MVGSGGSGSSGVGGSGIGPVNTNIGNLTSENSSPAHHRANSGPTIAISLFPENDSSNCKLFHFFILLLLSSYEY